MSGRAAEAFLGGVEELAAHGVEEFLERGDLDPWDVRRPEPRPATKKTKKKPARKKR